MQTRGGNVRAAAIVVAAMILAACGAAVSTWIGARLPRGLPLERLRASVDRYRIVLVGEEHGFIEPVQTIKQLLAPTPAPGTPGSSGSGSSSPVSSGRPFTHLAIEWSLSDQADIDRYLAGDDEVLTEFARRYGKLPGATREFISIFEFVRDHNRRDPRSPIAIKLIDVPHPIRSTPDEQRDQHMLSELRAVLDAGTAHRVLVYCGSVHAAKTGSTPYRDVFGYVDHQTVLGSLLREQYGDQVVSIRVLGPQDPLWAQLNAARPAAAPLALPLGPDSPDAHALFATSFWEPEPNHSPAHLSFDYAVWWPTSHKGTR